MKTQCTAEITLINPQHTCVTVMCDQVTWACSIVAFPSNLDICDCLLQAAQKVCPQCNTVVHAMDGVQLLGSLRTQWNVRVWGRVIRDKVRKVSKKASETREQTLHREEQNQTHMISINTYHLACAEGSALQCCSFGWQWFSCNSSEASGSLTKTVGHLKYSYKVFWRPKEGFKQTLELPLPTDLHVNITTAQLQYLHYLEWSPQQKLDWCWLTEGQC